MAKTTIKAKDILDICQDFIQDEIDQNGLEHINARDLRLITQIKEYIEDINPKIYEEQDF